MSTYEGKLFRGQVSKSEAIQIEIFEERLTLIGNNYKKDYAKSEYLCEAPMGKLPIRIELDDGAIVEVSSQVMAAEDLKTLVSQTSHFIYWIESNKYIVTILAILSILFLFLFVRFGAPFYSQKVADSLPPHVLADADDFILKKLDESELSKSNLSEQRKEEISKYFYKYGPSGIRIRFRKGNKLGANAFALAGNTMVFTDELVEKVDSTKLLLPIFFHELGHLEKRHLAASITSAISLNIFSLLLIGDMTGIAESMSNIAFTLVSLKLSRELEVEADLYAIDRLVENKISPKCFIKSFEFYVKEIEKYKDLKVDNSEALELFSTHPTIENRFNLINTKYKDSEACELN
ncbi:M48 family metallopeptidase [Halobacteriovorax sp. HLS]|uniref:M48 family metallopeptidase n=1 Tax=Halobacteriovorax sp. HLS TaxID=2234000 RepID=UPI000FDA5DE2|nr:M48 family metallopeptidase [Halobacteriovorax sp. HLS]